VQNSIFKILILEIIDLPKSGIIFVLIILLLSQSYYFKADFQHSKQQHAILNQIAHLVTLVKPKTSQEKNNYKMKLDYFITHDNMRFLTVGIPERWEVHTRKNPIFGPNFFYSLLRPKKKTKKKNLLNKISCARALKFHCSKIFKGL
jgi:hypothetical protein